MVTVKGYVDRVVIVAKGQVIATHARSMHKQTMVLDPFHFLAALDRKPGALDHAPVFRDWKLPPCFGRFRGELEGLHGAMSGSRRFESRAQRIIDAIERWTADRANWIFLLACFATVELGAVILLCSWLQVGVR